MHLRGRGTSASLPLCWSQRKDCCESPDPFLKRGSSVSSVGTTGRTSALVRARRHLSRLFLDSRGNDMIEYGLVTAGFGIVGVVVWNLIGNDIQGALGVWDLGMQDLWVVPDPLP